MPDGLTEALEQAVRQKTRAAKARGAEVEAGAVEEEASALEAELGPSAKLAAPAEDYRRLAAILGRPPRWLVVNGYNPFKCQVLVDRRAPGGVVDGKRLKVGILRQYTQGWPFDLERLAERIENEYGGEEYVLTIKHEGRPIWSKELLIDEPPIPQQGAPAGGRPGGPGLPTDDEEVLALEREREREERKARLVDARKNRVLKEREAERETAEPEDDDPAEHMQFLPPPPAPDMLSRGEAERLWREREERMTQRLEMERMRQETERRMDALLAEVRDLRSVPQDGGNTALIAAINQSTASQVEGLKMVMQMVSSQLANVVQSQQTQFQNTVEMMKLGQDSKGKEMELLLNAAGARQEMQALTADKQMELMRAGMDMASKMAGGGGADADPALGWANKAGNLLIGLISQNLANGGNGNAQATPTAELSEEQIQAAAQKIAQRAVAQMRQRTGRALPPPPAAKAAPAPPPAPVVMAPPPEKPGEREAFIRQVWPVLCQEIESQPVHSKTFDLIYSGPPRLLAELSAAQRVGDVVAIVSGTIPADELGAVAEKFMDERVQAWLYAQIQQMKERKSHVS